MSWREPSFKASQTAGSGNSGPLRRGGSDSRPPGASAEEPCWRESKEGDRTPDQNIGWKCCGLPACSCG